MAVRKFIGRDLPTILPQPAPTSLFMVGQEWQGSRYFAIRNEAPQFVLEGEDLNEVYQEAEAIIGRFLAKMHRYGFRS